MTTAMQWWLLADIVLATTVAVVLLTQWDYRRMEKRERWKRRMMGDEWYWDPSRRVVENHIKAARNSIK